MGFHLGVLAGIPLRGECVSAYRHTLITWTCGPSVTVNLGPFDADLHSIGTPPRFRVRGELMLYPPMACCGNTIDPPTGIAARIPFFWISFRFRLIVSFFRLVDLAISCRGPGLKNYESSYASSHGPGRFSDFWVPGGLDGPNRAMWGKQDPNGPQTK